MKKIRLFILCYAISIGILSTGCSKMLESKESKTQSIEKESQMELESESETEIKSQWIKASLATRYNDKEIFVYSDTTCLFRLNVTVQDGDFRADETFGGFEINKGESIKLTLDDLAANFFSDQAIITNVNFDYYPYVYGDTELNIYNYENIGAHVLIKCSSDKLVIYSDKDCFYDLHLKIQELNFYSRAEFRRIKLTEGKTITLTLDDLAPGFFSKDAVITNYYEPSDSRYVEKK